MGVNSRTDKFLKNYTFGLFFLSFLGVHIISINLGFFQLSPYRLLLLVSPLLILKIPISRINSLKKGRDYLYFQFFSFWAVYSLMLLLSIADLEGWLRTYSFVLSGLATTWFIGWYLTTKEDVIKALRFVEIFSVFIAIMAIYEIYTGHYFYLNETNLDFYQDRSLSISTIGFRVPITIFSNPNNFALFLLFGIMATYTLIRTKSTKMGRIISLIMTLILSFLMVSTQSRSGFIGLILFFLIIIYFYIRKGNALKRILFFIISLFLIVPWLGSNSDYYLELLEFDTSSGSDYVRINLIKNGFIFLENSYFLGVGLGNIEHHMSVNSVYNTASITNIHNWWMELLVSSGVIVFIFYMIVYIRNILRLFHFSKITNDKQMNFIAMSSFSFLVAFFITSVGSSSIMTIEWIWPSIALIMSFVNIISKQHKPNTI